MFLSMSNCLLHTNITNCEKMIFNLHEDSSYKLKDARTKMGGWIGIKRDKKGERMQQILITALDFLQKGKSLELVEAILTQAKEEFD